MNQQDVLTHAIWPKVAYLDSSQAVRDMNDILRQLDENEDNVWSQIYPIHIIIKEM